MKVNDVYNILDGIAPFASACPWDNSGLQCGDMNDAVTKVYVCLDADMYACESAKKAGCSLVVCHHPLIFDALRCITPTDAVYHYIRNGISVISVHTCLDATDGGVNDLLAAACKIVSPQKLMLDGIPLGRYGAVSVNDDMEYIDGIKRNLHTQYAEYTLSAPIKTVAVVSGGGGGAIDDAMAVGCDTLITGEAKHSNFVYARNNNFNLITLGHFETENIVVASLASRLADSGVTVVESERTHFISRG